MPFDSLVARAAFVALAQLIAGCGALRSSSQSTPSLRDVSLTAVNGEALAAQLHGRGDRGVVIVAHGGYSTNATWANQAHALASKGFRVLVFESRAVPAIAARKDIPCMYDAVCQSADVLVAVRWLRHSGATTIAVIGGSMGGGAVAQAAVDARANEIDWVVLLAPAVIASPERMQGQKLFITARGDANSEGLRLPRIQAQFDRTPAPKRLVLLDGSAHGQMIFGTKDSTAVLQVIVEFLSR